MIRERPAAASLRGVLFGVVLLAACGESTGIPDSGPASSEQLMLNRPFAPLDVDLFLPGFYPTAVVRPPAPGPERTEQEVRQLLQAYATADPDLDAGAAMAVFDDPAAIAKIASPTLRAALAALHGSIGESAIEFILNASLPDGTEFVRTVHFGDSFFTDVGENGVLVAEAQPLSNGQIQYVFNNQFVAESPFLLTSIMAHEVGHQDLAINHHEEVMMTAFHALLYLKQIARHPDLAASETRLTQLLNVTALARLNGGRGGTLGLLDSNGDRPVLPGSQFTNSSFASLIAPFGPTSTPGNSVVDDYVAALAAGGSGCPAVSFDAALISCVSTLSGGLAAQEAIAAARALNLDLGS